ncbi:PPOX class F420-dependent oxidoreductase [Rhizomonospora bruguierae]|uniref:PPOX class F420-dependent oxidoreductase n=1 Tax=Rhizomonospora bruguierae TaxID=1581705 RepID=UPI001BCCDA30|nr:PPOX class F420-dependent oxidoreductase [Micromonospora sp. NBRC 107566]
MAKSMTDGQWQRFVSYGTRTGKLATTRADGSPHVVPVWFVLDGDDVLFNTGKTSVKAGNLARDRRAVLCVDDENPPYAFVTPRGRATITEDPAETRLWATRIGERYMGADRSREFGARNAVPGELLVRLTVEKVLGYTGITD